MRKGMAKTGRLLCACLLVAGMSFVALPAFADDGNTEGNTEETAAKAASVNGVDSVSYTHLTLPTTAIV